MIKLKTKYISTDGALAFVLPSGQEDWIFREPLYVVDDTRYLLKAAGPFERFIKQIRSLLKSYKTFDPRSQIRGSSVNNFFDIDVVSAKPRCKSFVEIFGMESLGDSSHLRIAELYDDPASVGATGDIHGEKAALHLCGNIAEEILRRSFVAILAFFPIFDREKWLAIEDEHSKLLGQRHTAFRVCCQRCKLYKLTENKTTGKVVALELNEPSSDAADCFGILCRGNEACLLPMVLLGFYEVLDDDRDIAKRRQQRHQF